LAVKVVVASRNPVKIAATHDAFTSVFPDATIDVTGVDVDSGVGDQPDSDSTTREGARARALQASEAEPGADFWVGLEGGVEAFDGQLMAFAWMAIKGREGEISEARSTTLPLPPAVKELVDSGMELGEANDRVFSTVNSKQGGGAYGLLTDGRYTREGIYTQTLIIALTPFANPLYPQFNQNPGSPMQ
jgi:inosine/xanthosine triphosphatase